jgi:hypothetical protein
MTSALLYKEFRETGGVALLGAGALLAVASSSMGWWLVLFANAGGRIPFVSDTFQVYFSIVAGLLAIALGLRQSLADFSGDSYFFLLHRPVSRATIYGSKIIVGLLLYLVSAAPPILLSAWWAAVPGTHASSFSWSMTVGVWMGLLSITIVYLGAMLSGLRPAAWLGTRLAPVAAACLLAIVAAMLPWWAGILLIGLADAALVSLILLVADTRDFP